MVGVKVQSEIVWRMVTKNGQDRIVHKRSGMASMGWQGIGSEWEEIVSWIVIASKALSFCVCFNQMNSNRF